MGVIVIQFTDKLEEIMFDRRFNQRMLAEACKLTEAAISHYLAGTRKPTLKTLCAMCEALDTTPNYFLGYENTPTFSERKRKPRKA